MNKISSPSVARNKAPILEILKMYLVSEGKLLEIGSGTGEHAIHFADQLPKIEWVTSDVIENHPQITANLKEPNLSNIKGPEKLKIGKDDFPNGPFQYVFSANTLHIMSWKEGKTFFKLLGKRLREGALTFFYGPFNYNEAYTSKSNEEFDQYLKNRDPNSGIRNFEDVVKAMEKYGFKLLNDHEMPANNRLLVFERLEFKKFSR